MSFPKLMLRRILVAPVLLVLLFEEWGWAPLARAFAKLGQLPLWAKLEGRSLACRHGQRCWRLVCLS